MTQRISVLSRLGALLLFSIACAPAPRQEVETPVRPASEPATPVQDQAAPGQDQDQAAPTPADASTPPGPPTARLRHPGEPRTRADGGLDRLTAKAAPPPATGGPASPCVGRAPGERWPGADGGTCGCQPDGQITCRRKETKIRELADEQ